MFGVIGTSLQGKCQKLNIIIKQIRWGHLSTPSHLQHRHLSYRHRDVNLSHNRKQVNALDSFRSSDFGDFVLVTGVETNKDLT